MLDLSAHRVKKIVEKTGGNIVFLGQLTFLPIGMNAIVKESACSLLLTRR